MLKHVKWACKRCSSTLKDKVMNNLENKFNIFLISLTRVKMVLEKTKQSKRSSKTKMKITTTTTVMKISEKTLKMRMTMNPLRTKLISWMRTSKNSTIK